MVIEFQDYVARRACGGGMRRAVGARDRQSVPESAATYREILASLRGIAKVPGSESDPRVRALLEPARVELLAVAERMKPSARMFAADIAAIGRCREATG